MRPARRKANEAFLPTGLAELQVVPQRRKRRPRLAPEIGIAKIAGADGVGPVRLDNPVQRFPACVIKQEAPVDGGTGRRIALRPVCR